MAKSKKTTETPKSAGTKKAVREKVKEKPEAVIIYHTGDNMCDISKKLTGKDYLEMKVLAFNGKTYDTLKDGDTLRWEI